MKTNRDLLSESIADAKTVKETALANAKLALEEQFAPYLKEKLFAKLAEMEEEEEKEEVNEEMNEEAEEVSLDELLAELEEGETEINEAEKEETEEEEFDVAEMDEEELKATIEDVIKDMIAAGELEAGHEATEEEEEGEEVEGEETEETEEEEDINIEELLSESEDETPIEEATIEEGKGLGILKGVGSMFNPFKQPAEFVKEMEKKLKETPELKNDDEFMAQYKLLKSVAGVSSAAGSFTGGGGAGEKQSRLEEADKEKELEEQLNLVKTLRSELTETNLLNAKLLYTNKIFRSKTLTEAQKVKVLTAFDKATSKKEVELVYETLQESFKVSTLTKAPIKESLSSASKPLGIAKSAPIIENDVFSRMRELAFGNKK